MTAERARPPLRALRREPLIVDDLVVAERIRGALEPELARWARAWLVCWHSALVADDRFGRDEPWSIGLPLDAITSPRGAGGPERRNAVCDALVARGVLSVEGERGRRAVWRIAREAFGEQAAAIALDWSAIVAGSGAEPASLLVARALADVVVPLDAATAVPRRDLVERTGYQQKQVRVAVRRLAAAGLIDAEGEAGTTARYRFTARAMGREWRELAPREPAIVAAPTPASPEPSSPATPAPRPAADGLQLVVGGATLTIASGAAFEIGAGLAARLELGPDGRPRLVIAPPSES